MKAARTFGILAGLALILMIGCKSSTTTPTSTTSTSTSTTSTSSTTTTVPLDCETNHTAQVAFHNESANSIHDVIWDGSRITTLWPGTTSQIFTVASGAHTLTFNIANTNQAACSLGTQNLVQCKYYLFPCGK